MSSTRKNIILNTASFDFQSAADLMINILMTRQVLVQYLSARCGYSSWLSVLSNVLVCDREEILHIQIEEILKPYFIDLIIFYRRTVQGKLLEDIALFIIHYPHDL